MNINAVELQTTYHRRDCSKTTDENTPSAGEVAQVMPPHKRRLEAQ